MPAFAGFRVEGQRELVRALSQVSREVKTGMRAELGQVADPVRAEAERLALANIRNIGPAWSRMKVGVTTNYVYVAPKQRRHGGSPRPNLGGLLLKQAMLPAAQQKEPDVERLFEQWLDKIAAGAGF